MKETSKTNFFKQYEPDEQSRVAALFVGDMLVIHICGLDVESNEKA